MSTMTLTEFLRARITEDEATARRAAFGWGAEWRDGRTVDTGLEWSTVHSDGKRDMVGCEDGDVTRHIALHDPARVLAECEVKRAIVDLHSPTDQAQWYGDDEPPEDGLGVGCTTCGTVNEYAVRWPCETLRVLAFPYADHPDYLPRWAL